ncbi:helix-turn-helix transcriptional regulator [Brachybacterium sp. ACRRE]|uniref:helix-turn-helix transcriptional regulator n=1 Tax=Brachybacterium sp. ACRRE TaxID=2918184 RepID=UPI001EF16F1E|nr:helix-turn-helix transcriptional regulator [Brachybacterium sp. ACRRE]MCG7309897.1 helix-turn-helix transcriptional regulator [Brachybacterium sp. ACRRE]
MDPITELREFLASRRARVRPEDAGLPAFGSHRRVEGLRREEVALLAGISVEYYTRMERGRVGSVSEEVLRGIARALLLDDIESEHLGRLVRAAGARRGPAARSPRPVGAAPSGVSDTVHRMLDMLPAPAFVRNGRFDVLAANAMGRALYSPVIESMSEPNTARFAFLVPSAQQFFVDFPGAQRDVVAFLHAEAGRDPFSKDLQDLVGELSTRSDRFRELWAEQDVKLHRAGTKHLRHLLVGEMVLDYEAFEISASPGLRLNVYTAAPGSSAADALAVLGSWAASTADGADGADGRDAASDEDPSADASPRSLRRES